MSGGAELSEGTTEPEQAEEQSGNQNPSKVNAIVLWLSTLKGAATTAAVTAVVGGIVSLAFAGLSASGDAIVGLGEEPVLVAVEVNPNRTSGFSDADILMFLPEASTVSGSPGRACGDFHPWGRENGAVDLGNTYLEITVQGVDSAEVNLRGLVAIASAEEEPVNGFGIVCPSAGEAELRSVDIQLDSPDRRGEYITNEGVRPFAFTVGEGETETFLVTASTVSKTYRWHLELSVIAAGTTQTIKIDDNGQDFVTRPSFGDLDLYEWDYVSEWFGPSGQTPTLP